MAWWKKGIILLSIAIVFFWVGFGTNYYASRKPIGDLRERVEQITRERDEAREAELGAKEAARKLDGLYRESEKRVDSLTIRVTSLADSNRRAIEGFGRIESSISILSSGISGVTDSVTESGGLIQESMGIILDVSKRNGTVSQ